MPGTRAHESIDGQVLSTSIGARSASVSAECSRWHRLQADLVVDRISISLRGKLQTDGTFPQIFQFQERSVCHQLYLDRFDTRESKYNQHFNWACA
jgi:hypothetical protein